MADLLDIGHVFGSDIQITAKGDLATASVVERSQQRVLRRLLTPLRAYIFHLGYGAGVPAHVGEVLNLAEVRALIRGQMLLEASVIRSPEPVITVTGQPQGVSVDIAYLVAPDRQPAALSFDVSA